MAHMTMTPLRGECPRFYPYDSQYQKIVRILSFDTMDFSVWFALSAFGLNTLKQSGRSWTQTGQRRAWTDPRGMYRHRLRELQVRGTPGRADPRRPLIGQA